MNHIEQYFHYQDKVEEIRESLEGAEIQYKGYYGTIMYINLDYTATIYLEDAEGKNWEEVVKLTDLAKEIY